MSVVEKIGKLLRHAEQAATEEEANAFLSKAQELATLTSVDLAVARQTVAKKEERERPTRKLITTGESGKKNNKHLIELFLAVSQSNNVRCTIFGNSTGVTAYGFPSDIELVETLYSSLAFQMVEAGNAYLKSGEHKKETRQVYVSDRDGWGGRYVEKPIDGRTARASFYVGFVRRISTRLYDAKVEAEAQVSETSFSVLDDNGEEAKTTGALVLKAKEVEVIEHYTRETAHIKRGWSGSGGAKSYGSQAAGSTAGDKARIGSQNAIGGSRTAVN